LFDAILNTYHTKPGKGVPIGNLISQHLANFYLGLFDHWIKEVRKIKGYVRYMDDFLLFSHAKACLKLELLEIIHFLEKRLALKLKENIQINRTVLGVPFLGFRVFPAHIRLLSRTRTRFSRKLREYERKFIDGRWTEYQLVRHTEALIAFTDAGNSAPFRRMVIDRFGVLS
jgi:RNA-directed DNA polymerase